MGSTPRRLNVPGTVIVPVMTVELADSLFLGLGVVAPVVGARVANIMIISGFGTPLEDRSGSSDEVADRDRLDGMWRWRHEARVPRLVRAQLPREAADGRGTCHTDPPDATCTEWGFTPAARRGRG